MKNKVTLWIKKSLFLLALFSLTTGQTECTIRTLVKTDPENFDFSRLTGGINTLINFFILMAGGILMFFIIIGGYQYLTSLGNPEQAQKAKTTLTWAIIGFIIVVTAYLVVRYGLSLFLTTGTTGEQQRIFGP